MIVVDASAAERLEVLPAPRDDRRLPLTGVFAIRSPDRPNPIGPHGVTVDQLYGCDS